MTFFSFFFCRIYFLEKFYVHSNIERRVKGVPIYFPLLLLQAHSLIFYHQFLPEWYVHYYGWWTCVDLSLSPDFQSLHWVPVLVWYILWVLTNVWQVSNTIISYRMFYGPKNHQLIFDKSAKKIHLGKKIDFSAYGTGTTESLYEKKLNLVHYFIPCRKIHSRWI